MVPCSLMDVLKDESPSSPSVPSKEVVLHTDVFRPEKEPCMRMTSASCCVFVVTAAPPPPPPCRTALQRVLTSLSMSSTESEDSVS